MFLEPKLLTFFFDKMNNSVVMLINSLCKIDFISIQSMCIAETEAGTKYTSIRTQFVKSKNKLQQATRSGAGASNVKLWKYHNLCLFLRDHVDVAPQLDSIATAVDKDDHQPPLTEQVNTF